METTEQNCYADWLQQCPFAMMATDDSGVIRWTNPAFEQLCGLEAEQLLGSSADNPPDAGLQALFGDSNNVSISHATHGEIVLERSVKAVTDDAGNSLQLHYFKPPCADAQLQLENEQLRQQVENLTLTDELTGLANERALSQNLAIQVTRSRRYHNPLSLALVDIKTDDQASHILDEQFDETIVAISHFLRDRLRWADFIARCQPSRFVVVLPETGEEEAKRLFQDIVNERDKIDLPAEQSSLIQFIVGVAEWEKGNDPRLLIERASKAQAG
ncbi:MAG: diguanylate cyclase [Chromatiales bacterium]|jgi:diguanylate cyclase (GGDEF)-like protein/PAS domain S-box-containing protein